MMSRHKTALAIAVCLTAPVAVTSCSEPVAAPPADRPATQPTSTPASTQPADRRVELPGVVADREGRFVDVDAKVCLDAGLLEFVACTPDTKEHESLVVIDALPRDVHVALLLIGLQEGHPGMSRRVDAEGEPPRWVAVPPRGDAVGVFLVFRGIGGEPLEFPISDFIRPSGQAAGDAAWEGGLGGGDAGFENTFVFAGSRVIDDETADRRYLADRSGHVISIATFGDEVLCLPTLSSADNASLLWEVNPEVLPKVGSKVTLRLRAKPGEGVGGEP